MGLNHRPWQITAIDRNGSIFTLTGSEEVMRQAYDDWKQEPGRLEGTAAELWEVRGVTDSADRTNASLIFRRDCLAALILVEL